MTTPRDVFLRLSEDIGAGRFDELAALYAEDTVVEHPQAVPRPTRTEGRAAIHARFTSPLARTLRLRPYDVVVHETTDPEVIVAEYAYTVTSPETGKQAEARNVQMLRVRDGLIVHSRDYHDYLAMARVRDSLDALAKAYTDAPPRTLDPRRPRPGLFPSDSPRGTFQRVIFGVSDGKWDELPTLYAEETDVSHPFWPGSKTLRTREDLREHFAAGATLQLDIEASNLVLYPGLDPEVVIGEFEYQGRTGFGDPVRIANIYVMRVRDGLIVESRDYGDRLGIAGDTGRIPELAGA